MFSNETSQGESVGLVRAGIGELKHSTVVGESEDGVRRVEGSDGCIDERSSKVRANLTSDCVGTDAVHAVTAEGARSARTTTIFKPNRSVIE